MARRSQRARDEALEAVRAAEERERADMEEAVRSHAMFDVARRTALLHGTAGPKCLTISAAIVAVTPSRCIIFRHELCIDADSSGRLCYHSQGLSWRCEFLA
eukprot:3808538-Pleurochrysis_carterae.AAC.1